MRICAILNAGGGTMLQLGPDAVVERLKSAFARNGVEADVRAVPGAELCGEIERAIAAARAGQLDAVVVGGGDGTASTAAGLMVDTGVPLGVLGLGTLNHFAKDLGMPLELEEAAAALARGSLREIDVADCNGRIFVNNSLIGVYPYMVLDRERRRRLTSLGKWPAMSLAFLRMLWRFPRRRLRLRTAETELPYRTPCLFIGNNEYAFDFLKLGRRRLDTGQLYLLVARAHSPWRLFLLACRAALGRLREAKDLEALHAQTAVIEARTSRLPVSFDGEVEHLRPPLRYRSRPGALKVIAPGV
jgi:diacylglycerol kinase family enzyme